MRKIKEVLRLKWANQLSHRQIAMQCGISRPTVSEYIRRAEESKLSWPLPESLNERQLENRLFPPPPQPQNRDRKGPNWHDVCQQLKSKNVTLFLLWQEYRSIHPQGYQYSWFCDHYKNWLGKRDVVMRQNHKAGEKLFVDYAGHTMPVVDRLTGEIRQAQIFVGVMGASNYTYADATWTQSLPDWIGSHQRCFAFLGGVPDIVVPDNLRAGVSKAHRYDPDINPTYQDMAVHYGVAVIPARVRRPKDKAKAELGVQVVERWILAALRHHTFFSLAELNQRLSQLITTLNARAFKKLPGSRQSQFDAIDHPALSALPAQPYSYAEWKKVRVHIDYHVEIEGHYYSVPYTLVKKQLDARFTQHTVECFHQGQRVASHVRSYRRGGHSTVTAHMPESHRQYGDWSPQRLVNWARQTGPGTAEIITRILAARQHPQQGFRSCLGIMRLEKSYTKQRLEAACQRALTLGSYRYKSIESILEHGLDQQALAPQQELELPQDHDNVRGSSYYH
ncbi:MAG: IS21 family transposase [Gammaproteobacteria bacterium]|nr:IS21 family transposase [Gammaproteobacteria bacterium]